MTEASSGPTDQSPACRALQEEARGIECGGTLKERKTGASVTVRTPGRAYQLDTPGGAQFSACLRAHDALMGVSGFPTTLPRHCSSWSSKGGPSTVLWSS